MIERINPNRFASDEPDFDAERFANDDYKIKTGMCPNGCGLLSGDKDGQGCKKCGFFTNVKCEQTKQ